MTTECRNRWSQYGQCVAGVTLIILGFGAAAAYAQDQAAINLSQAATAATLSAQLAAVSARLEKLEAQNNYVLMALVGTLITQLVQLRVGKNR